MARYRDALPQHSGKLFLTDGGLETTLIYRDGFELPYFAAFHLYRDPAGRKALSDYASSYASLAREHGVGLLAETATWRASRDWGRRLGYGDDELAEVNRLAVADLEELRDEYETEATPVVISGNIGPRGDGYDPAELLDEAEAEAYHAAQVRVFADAAADLVTALTMTHPQEAVGITRAAVAASMPVVVSFTVETDGSLPTGQPLGEAIRQVDEATGGAPEYFMINCAHTTHFDGSLEADADWASRIRGIRANASSMSHAELDAATELDAGDPAALAQDYRSLRDRFGRLNVLGGCCGTDERHIDEIFKACRAG